MLYGLEKIQEMEMAELKMLRLGVTRMDKIRNEYMRGKTQVGPYGENTRQD